jgi:vitamin B12/bleomycin/antimicrobial peptide transport system ATP-binding/permease protein
VLLSKPRLLLMDESTSALDTGNEAALYAALGKSGITYVSVGHRPSLVGRLLCWSDHS